MVGALNWGLVGLSMLINGAMGWNVVNMLLGSMPQIEAVVYILVGLSALWLIISHKKDCRNCSAGSM